jgi:hypothetical protein
MSLLIENYVGYLLGGSVALPHGLVDGLLPEGDLALLLKVLVAHLLLQAKTTFVNNLILHLLLQEKTTFVNNLFLHLLLQKKTNLETIFLDL